MASRALTLRVRAEKPGFSERLAERRRMLEQVRTVSVGRVRSDLDKIVKREAEYAQRVLQELVPVRIVWNEGMSLDKLLPFRVEIVDTTAGAVRRADVAAPPAPVDEADPVDKPIA